LDGKAKDWLESEIARNILIKKDLLLLRKSFLQKYGSIEKFMSTFANTKSPMTFTGLSLFS